MNRRRFAWKYSSMSPWRSRWSRPRFVKQSAANRTRSRRRKCDPCEEASIAAAGRQLASQQGPNPPTWRADATKERIGFAPGLLKTTMRYTNRPSGIQQVISFGGHR